MGKTVIGIWLFLIAGFSCNAQNEYSNWYFGYFCGLTFNSGIPELLEGSRVLNLETVATISDVNGTHLFHTDGVNIWNRNFDTVNIGQPMLSGRSSSQAGFIIQKPLSPTIYYIFSTDQILAYPWGQDTITGCRYSIFDLEANNGVGGLIEANTVFIDSAFERFTAVKHENGRDVWCIAPIWDPDSLIWGDDVFYERLLSDTGLGPPIFIHTGTPFLEGIDPEFRNDKNNRSGHLRASPNGKYLVSGAVGSSFANLYSFDNATGHIELLESFPLHVSYGVEFSADSRFLYIDQHGNDDKLHQLDLQAPDIWGSKVVIDSIGTSFGVLQLAPDKKIYHALQDSMHTAVIHHPSLAGAACGYDFYGPTVSLEPFNLGTLSGAVCKAGLSTGITSEIIAPNFNYNYHCFGDTAFFTLLETEFDSVFWDFGDPLSGADNYSTEENPWHIYVEPNYHRVGLTLFNGPDSLTGFHWVRATWPTLGLQDDTLVCENETLTLQMLENGTVYTWQDSTVSLNYDITEAGTYWVSADLYGCVDSDTIQVAEVPLHEFSLGGDTTVCVGDTITLFPNDTLGFMGWSTGSTNFSIQVWDSGYYWADMINALTGCVARDSIHVNQPLPPQVATLPQYWVCYYEHPFDLSALPSGGWWYGAGITDSLDGRFEPAIAGAGGHTLYYEIPDSMCPLLDSINIEVMEDQAVISAQGNLLTATPTNGSDYQWYLNGNPIPGADEESWLAQTSGNYVVTFTNSLGCHLESYVLEFTLQISVQEWDYGSITILPNPAQDVVHLSNIPSGKHTITLMDALGKTVLQVATKENRVSIPCGDIPSGIYLLTLTGESGSYQYRSRIVVM